MTFFFSLLLQSRWTWSRPWKIWFTLFNTSAGKILQVGGSISYLHAWGPEIESQCKLWNSTTKGSVTVEPQRLSDVKRVQVQWKERGFANFLGTSWQIPPPCWLKQQKFIFSYLWKPGVLNRGVGRAASPPQAPERKPLLSLPASGGSTCSLACSHLAPSSVCHRMAISLVCLLLSLIRTLVIGFHAHPGDAGWAHLKILVLITSAKALFTNSLTCIDPSDVDKSSEGPPFNTPQRRYLKSFSTYQIGWGVQILLLSRGHDLTKFTSDFQCLTQSWTH